MQHADAARCAARGGRVAALLGAWAMAPALTVAAPDVDGAGEGGGAEPAADAGPADAELVVEGRAPRRSASERRLDRAAIEATPARSTDDLLRAMPGLHQSAHGGRGKAYQYFLRGFDAVHGADIAVRLEDVPINEPSNVHAHGYLDLHFIPTALVSAVALRPGPFEAEVGDFGVAGAAALSLGLAEPGGWVKLGAGTDRSGAAAAAWRPATAPSGTFVFGELDGGQGVGMARASRQARVAGGLEKALGGARARVWLLAYDGTFESPGVLREDDLASGAVGFYDAYPGSGGGRSSRALGAASIWGGDAGWAGRATLWAGARALSLEQNFTGTQFNADQGDGSLQTYAATSAGLSARAYALRGAWLRPSAGLQGRVDGLRQREASVDRSGAVWAERAALTAESGALSAWAALPARPAAWIELEPGARADLFLISVDDADLGWASALSPKLAARLFPEGGVNALLSYGRGLRSPDVRGARDGGVAALARADSAEIGVLATPAGSLSLRAVGFWTGLSDELVFDPVAARYLAIGQTRRLGLDAGLSLRPAPTLRVDADLTLSDGVFVATGEPIPYAPRLLGVLGVAVERAPVGQAQLTAGLRAFVLGPRPLPGGFLSHSAWSADLTSALWLGDWGLSIDGVNIFGHKWRDGEFVFASR